MTSPKPKFVQSGPIRVPRRHRRRPNEPLRASFDSLVSPRCDTRAVQIEPAPAIVGKPFEDDGRYDTRVGIGSIESDHMEPPNKRPGAPLA